MRFLGQNLASKPQPYKHEVTIPTQESSIHTYIYMRVYIQTSVSISNVLAMGTVTGSHVRATISDLECRAIEAVIVRIGYL